MPDQSTLVSVEEYIETDYEDGDREYVDGLIVERNLGEQSHSWLQGELVMFFGDRRKTLRTYAFPEQRVQVKPTRFRVPDVCVYIGGRPAEEIFRTPPFLAIEILSKLDRVTYVQGKIGEYLSFGVPFVWLIDPYARQGWTHTATVTTLSLHTTNPGIELTQRELLEMIEAR